MILKWFAETFQFCYDTVVQVNDMQGNCWSPTSGQSDKTVVIECIYSEAYRWT